MGLRIALVAPPWYTVPPHGYGGIELVVSLLDRELRRRGHEVTLLASDGSPGALPCAPQGWDADLGSTQQGMREATYAAVVGRVIDSLGDLDVIHDHAGAATLSTLAMSGRAPVLHTVHGPLSAAERALYGELGEKAGLVSISTSQRGTAPTLNWVGCVFNAVDVENLQTCARADKEPYLLCLARVCEEKGQHIAIEVARRTGMRLILAGKVEPTPAGREYFEGEIAPFIDGHRVVHIDNVGGADKARLLARATALLAPLQWNEPFGLALVEAMASGTPVVVTPRGAAPELVVDGVTGLFAEDVDEMAAAVARVGQLDPAACAREARRRFEPASMADGYVSLYERVASRAASAVA